MNGCHWTCIYEDVQWRNFQIESNGQAFSKEASTRNLSMNYSRVFKRICVKAAWECRQQNMSKDEVVQYSPKVTKKANEKKIWEDNVCQASFGAERLEQLD